MPAPVTQNGGELCNLTVLSKSKEKKVKGECRDVIGKEGKTPVPRGL